MSLSSAAAKLQAARALLEGAPVSIDLLAQLMGRSEKYLKERALREGWRDAGSSAAEPEALEKRLVVLSDQLVGDLEAAGAEGRSTGSYDKSRIDALSVMLRMVEKLSEMIRVPERAAEKQKRSDAELAAALALIDARIVEIACELAASLGSEDLQTTGTRLPAAR
ncbi:hypothetical protein [Chelativorans sp. Marseille-P2723]|uniref:hypothetical protein n=1 Tax=Chelativorans sp. Marseille-P2723 TaxID=2709133 RepID=UPI0015714844|nr:hypothetical protein [Chelativorans sp. Marseille-P2723]